MAKCSINKEDFLFDLEKGLEYEQRALEACQEIIPFLDDPKEKAVIERIAEDEERHIKIVEFLIDITKKYFINQ
ncbi:MAG: ferritin-like domain-containing protein [Minisyncoccales bacterium]|jgi:rubrerythrin